MKTSLLVPLIEAVFGLALLTVLMVSGKRHAARWPFSLCLISLTSWGIFTFMARFTAGSGAALVGEKLIFSSIMIAAMSFYWSVVCLTGQRPKRNLLYTLLGSDVIVLGLMPTDLVVSDMKAVWYGEAPVIGPIFPLYLLSAYAPVVYSIILLVRRCRQTRIIDERIRDQYLIMGAAALLLGATTDYFSILNVNLYPLGTFGNILFCIVATAALLKYNLPELRVLMRNAVTLLLTSLLVFSVFGSFIYLTNYLFLDITTPTGIALAEIADNRSILYDPQVVDACLSLLEKNEPAFNQIMAIATAKQRDRIAAAMKDDA